MPFKKGETPKGAKPFPKGVSGNPAGKKLGVQNSKTILQKLLDMASQDQPGLTRFEAILANEVVRAERGDGYSIDRVLNRLEGKPSQAMTVEGNEEKPLSVTFTLKIDNG